MRNYFVFMILLIFLSSCSSERSFQAGDSQRLKPATGHEISKGSDAPSAEIAPGLQEREAVAQTKKNTLPELTRVKLVPEVFHPGDTLGVEASASDKDGDDVSIRYAWFVNDEPAGETSRLEVPVKRGDNLRVTITPFDGKEQGSSVVLRREIANMPPMFSEVKKGVFDGEIYTCQVVAEDPDGDPVAYSLKTAPKGMEISKDTGLMSWQVPKDFKGPAKLSVIAEDGQGGKAEYDLSLTIKEDAPTS